MMARVLAWVRPGRWFSSVEFPVRGVHGSPRTAPQVAVVTGGHPAVPAPRGGSSAAVDRAATWWASAMAGLLDVTAPADARSEAARTARSPDRPQGKMLA